MLKILPFPLVRYTSSFHVEFVILPTYMQPRKTNYREKYRKLGLQTGSSYIFVIPPNEYSLYDSVAHVD